VTARAGSFILVQLGVTNLKESRMSVAKIIEISAHSEDSFEDAARRGIAKASETVHGIKSAWVEGQQLIVEDGRVTHFRVAMKVTFVLD
jgi:dodecin